MGRMKYVQRRANRFEFRFPLPDDLAGKPVPAPWPEALVPLVNTRTGRLKTELIRSLQTTDSRAAERKALGQVYRRGSCSGGSSPAFSPGGTTG